MLSKRNLLEFSLLKRNTFNRRQAIQDLISEKEVVTVDELARTFATSEVTIRKDLARMEEDGLLLRRYGGASAIPKEVSGTGSVRQFSDSQQLIVKAAAMLIKDYSRIVIDSGNTTAALIPHLQEKQGLIVMTNSLLVANAINDLESEPPALLMTGGTWDEHSRSFQGQTAESVLRSFDFDQLFIGADGIDAARGTTTFNELLGLSRVMAEISREVIVMVESSKFGRRIPNQELPWEMIDVLVTDDGVKPDLVGQIEAQQVRIILAC